MPEGDSIHRIQKAIVDLVGQPIERATTQGLVRAITGRTITAIAAHGKHLVLDLDDGTEVRAHLGMYGRFRRFARPEGEQRLATMSPGRATLALVLPDAVLVWIGAKTIEIAARRAPRHGMALATLGPDLLAAGFDASRAVERALVEHDTRLLADVLLDQRVAAGIGNVYKSELCFLHRKDPRAPIAGITRALWLAIFTDAQRLLAANATPGGGPRRTLLGAARRGVEDADDRYFVYGRTNKPCRRCQTPIVCFSLGEPPRWTWACPTCQA